METLEGGDPRASPGEDIGSLPAGAPPAGVIKPQRPADRAWCPLGDSFHLPSLILQAAEYIAINTSDIQFFLLVLTENIPRTKTFLILIYFDSSE